MPFIDIGLIKIILYQEKLTNVRKISKIKCNGYKNKREHSGSVVECLTQDRGAAVSILTGVTGLWSLTKTHL